jgi:type IV pilus assembly protein PilB
VVNTLLNPDGAMQVASFLVSQGELTPEQFSNAKSVSVESGRDVLSVLIEYGSTDYKKIRESISNAYGLVSAHLRRDDDVSPDAVALLQKNFIKLNRIYPFKISGTTLSVAISEPQSLNQISGVRLITGLQVETHTLAIDEMDALISKLTSVQQTSHPEERPMEDENYLAPDDLKRGDLSGTSEARSSEVIDLVNSLIDNAIKLGVSDIHVEPYKDHARVRYRQDGVLQDQKKISKSFYEHYAAITTRIKIMSKLDIAERRLPQDGAITFKSSVGRDVDIRVSVLPTNFAERVVMRLLDHSAFELSLDTLGMLSHDQEALENAIDSPQGMVLVTGPTGSGKSTTLYACLNRINREGINILTAEDPVEYVMDGVGQVQIKDDIGLDFKSALRSFLRQDPEVILVGEIRDRETGDIAIKASLTGHLVLSTLHTNDAVSTITRLVNMGIPPYLITSSLSLVVAQRLARKNCQSCNAPDETVGSDQLHALGFTAQEISQMTVYKGKGCKKCNGTGYKGRQGIYEILKTGPALKQAILDGKGAQEMLSLAKEKHGFSTMQEVGRGFVKQGILSVSEYQRVLIF